MRLCYGLVIEAPINIFQRHAYRFDNWKRDPSEYTPAQERGLSGLHRLPAPLDLNFLFTMRLIINGHPQSLAHWRNFVKGGCWPGNWAPMAVREFKPAFRFPREEACRWRRIRLLPNYSSAITGRPRLDSGANLAVYVLRGVCNNVE